MGRRFRTGRSALLGGAAALTAALTAAGMVAGPAGAQVANAKHHHHAKAVKTVQIAYLSFAVQNSYDAPMLAAARQQAKRDHAVLKVFDANNSPTKQYAELQDAITAHQYQGIIVQPIFGTGLMGLVRQAIGDHIQVANLDQELGKNLSTDKPQVKGLAANVVFIPTRIGRKLGNLVDQACKKHNPCNVGYMYDIKASALDEAIYRGFIASTRHDKNVKIVTTGQSYFTPSKGLAAAQNMLQANPNLTLIVGSDQGIEGAQQAVAAAGKKVILVGYGASAAALKGIRSGAWYGDVAQEPATEGRLAVKDLVKAIRTGVKSGAVDPVAKLPNAGVVTRKNVKKFHPEWPG